ncbi:MAG TPA: hypothetical protein VFW96_09600, partial [Thermomicrobiales bacterium]|nr:hypothetical protein [Thermomicrobiales bacterium]
RRSRPPTRSQLQPPALHHPDRQWPMAARRLFDAYLFVDWSARGAPSPARPCADAIWIGELAADADAPTETYCRTRAIAAEHLLARLRAHVAAGRRVLAGFDFPFGYPAGCADALDLRGPGYPPQVGLPWLRAWLTLAAMIRDGARNDNNRFAVAARLNARADNVAPGPFWGAPRAAVAATLAPTSPGFPYALGDGTALARLRRCERCRRGVQETWKLLGVGSVGSQALLGIPRVWRLRSHPDLRVVSRVWPFETGFTGAPAPPTGPRIVHAEVWPGTLRKEDVAGEQARTGAIKDQAQVRLLCRWAAERDASGDLGRSFDRPPDLTDEGARAAIEEEGWILGG